MNPQRFYRAPSDVMRDRRFGDAERMEILVAWKGMTNGDAERQQVIDTMTEIERKLGGPEPAAQKQ